MCIRDRYQRRVREPTPSTMSCNVPYSSNSIVGKPSSRVLAAPGGGSTISLGADINSSAAPAADKTDSAAVQFLEETNTKINTGGKLSVRDFHMIGSFPLFEGIYSEQRVSSMSYAEKVSNGSKLMRALNEFVGAAPAPVVQQQTAPAQVYQAPAQAVQQAPFATAPTGMARTQCVGGVAENSIGDIPSVKLHHAPGGSSSLTSGGATMASLGGMDSSVQYTEPEGPTRTRCTGGTAQNAIGSVPSVKVHAAPGGGSSINLGADINSSAAPSSDKTDAAAVQFLQETNAKVSTGGKLSVRDFHMIGSFSLFEGIYSEQQISSMSYAEKMNNTGRLLGAINALVGEPATRAVLAPQPTNAGMQQQSADCFSSEQAGPSRTKCVGNIVENSIGDVPSVKIHHAPGGSSSIQLW
eukprot:TRINITY_DN3215_c0_g2_i1.p1 TRINITY_DN3215_c0_g2~~TRINITY_DN3215_c0_g2_i1.p1  ORF type:complete len:411 (-),score=103.33 TRINITY_DN3215_c0_g2_i1:253-1485(-)